VRTMVLQPTAGSDTITGYTGADVLSGGPGNDVLTGGAGRDRFVFDLAPNAGTNIDTVTDFTPGQDKIVLSRAVFTALPVAGTTLDPDSNANVGYNPATGALTYDADGEGTGAAAVTVAILGLPTHPASLGMDVLVGP
jgi:Ca2+-binding RTX toxin-like protein